jgi:hypothetical protein
VDVRIPLEPHRENLHQKLDELIDRYERGERLWLAEIQNYASTHMGPDIKVEFWIKDWY